MLRLAPLDALTWDTALGTPELNQQATLFHTTRWLDFIARAKPVHVERLGIFDEKQLCGLFPILRRTRGPLTTRMGSPLAGMATPYLGPLIADAHLLDTLALFDQLVRRDHAAALHLRFGRPIDLAVATALGYTIQQPIPNTLVLSLAGRTVDQLWQGLKKNCRAHVRQAENRGVEIVEAEGPEIIEEYWRLEQEIFARQGVPVPNHRAFYYALWETFHSAGQLNIFAARHAGRVIGVQINAWYADTLYGLYGATDSAYRKSYVGNLLEWRLIAWAAQRGMARYDMIGGTDAGMAEFKQSFGAVPVETPALSSERWRSIALTRRLYGLLRQTVTRARRTPATSPGAAREDTSQI